MKKSIVLLLITLFYLPLMANDQDTIQQPKEGKCMVYFTRTSSMAFLIGFKIFDSQDFLGNLKSNNYIAYECDPGHHIFIAKSETADFLEANLEAGKVYVVNAEVRSGLLKARVQLVPVDRQSKKYDKQKKNTLKLLAKEDKGANIAAIEKDDESEDVEDTPSKTIEKFWKKKAKNDKITQLTAEMYFD